MEEGGAAQVAPGEGGAEPRAVVVKPFPRCMQARTAARTTARAAAKATTAVVVLRRERMP